MQKMLKKFGVGFMVLLMVSFYAPSYVSAAPNWNVIGSYVVNINYLSVDYPENLVLSGTNSALTGTLDLVTPSGGSPWTIDTGSVVGNVINFEGYYNSNTALRAHFSGTIANDGSMSGTWADITVDSRAGTWTTTSGVAVDQSQTCSTINLVSGTKTQTAGYTETAQAGPATAILPSSYTPGTFVSAVATPLTVIPPWLDPTTDSNFVGSGAVWVSTSATWPGDVGNTEGSSHNDQWRLFEDSFTLPAGAIVSSANLSYTGDNGAEVYLNGNPVFLSSTGSVYGLTSGFNFSTPYIFASAVNTSFIPVPGLNKLDFVVRNWGDAQGFSFGENPTGLVYKATVSYCVPTGGTISGMKYNDLNRNGKKDVNEPGLQGWVIRLLADTDTSTTKNETLVATAITDANGNYTFTNVVSGTYEIRETHQNGWKRMSKNPKEIVITAGSVVTDVNFGNATKHKEEKEDTNKDDNREDQSGKYYSNHDRSSYSKNQNTNDHSHDQRHN